VSHTHHHIGYVTGVQTLTNKHQCALTHTPPTLPTPHCFTHTHKHLSFFTHTMLHSHISQTCCRVNLVKYPVSLSNLCISAKMGYRSHPANLHFQITTHPLKRKSFTLQICRYKWLQIVQSMQTNTTLI